MNYNTTFIAFLILFLLPVFGFGQEPQIFETGTLEMFEDDNNLFLPRGDIIDISNDYAVIANEYSSQVYIFKKSNNSWKKIQDIYSPDDRNNFGSSVAISENYLVIGAKDEYENGPGSGAIYIYKKNHEEWCLIEKKNGENNFDNFGKSVDIFNNFLIVGVPGFENQGVDATGMVAVFRLENNNWNLFQELIPSNINSREFGNIVALSSSFLLVGGDQSYPNHRNGLISSFKWTGANWFENEEISLPLFGIALLELNSESFIVSTGNFGYSKVFEFMDIEEEWREKHQLNGLSGNSSTSGASITENYIAYSVGGTVFLREKIGENWIEVDQFEVVDELESTGGIVFVTNENLIFIYRHFEGSLSEGNFNINTEIAIFNITENNEERLVLEQTLTSVGSNEFNYFGNSVSIDSNLLAIGASGYDIHRGRVYTFERTKDNKWSPLHSFTPSEIKSFDQFGNVVALSNNLLAISALGTDSLGYKGKVYIYTLNGGKWNFLEVVQPNQLNDGSYFGASIAINENYLIIGAPSVPPKNVDTSLIDYKFNNSQDPGAVYVYENRNNSFHFLQKIEELDGQDNDAFGYSVAVSGNDFLVGIPGNNNNMGSATCYHIDVSKPIPVSIVTEFNPLSNLDTGEQFGWSVDIKDNEIAVGAPQTENSTQNGKVYIYSKNGDNWLNHQILIADESENTNQFGWSVSIDDQIVAISSKSEILEAKTNGVVYIFEKDDSTWNQKNVLAISDSTTNNYFGTYVVVDKNINTDIIVGSSHTNNYTGKAYSFYRECTCPENGIVDEQSPSIKLNPSRYWNEDTNSAFILQGDSLLIVKEECFNINNSFSVNDIIVSDTCSTKIDIEVKEFQSPNYSSNEFDDFYLDKSAQIIWTAEDLCGNISELVLSVEVQSVNCLQVDCDEFIRYEDLVNKATQNCQNGSSRAKFKRKKRNRFVENEQSKARNLKNNSLICTFEGEIICENNNDFLHDVIVQISTCSNPSFLNADNCGDIVSNDRNCGQSFFDSGGSNGLYQNNEVQEWTFCPDDARNQSIVIEFTTFNIENSTNGICSDILYVYDGVTSSTNFVGAYCGNGLNNAPNHGTITATNATGCLTFKFESNDTISLEGWKASINCIYKSTNNERSNDCIKETRKFTVIEDSGPLFGESISADSNFMVTADLSEGNIYIFEKKNNRWNKVQEIKEVPISSSEVVFNGNYIVFGDLSDPPEVPEIENEGAVYIYKNEGEGWIFDTKLKASISSFEFGSSIDLKDSLLIVGSPGVGHNSESFETVFIYQLIGGEWVETQILGSNNNFETDFGATVKILDDFILVTAPSDNFSGHLSGVVYIFQYNGEEWIFRNYVTTSDSGPRSYIGDRIKTDGNNFAILDFPNLSIFEWDGQEWSESTPTLSSPRQISFKDGIIGYSTLYDVRVLNKLNEQWVESYKTEKQELDSGRGVYISNGQLFSTVKGFSNSLSKIQIYDIPSNNEEDLNLIQNLYHSGDDRKNYMGRSVTIDENFIAVGAGSYNNNRGAVYTYERNEQNKWEDLGIITRPEGIPLDQFGRSISISDSLIAVSAMGYNNAEYIGIVYIYKRAAHPFGPWKEVAVIDPTLDGGLDWEYFGLSLALKGDYLVVGAPTPANHPDHHDDDENDYHADMQGEIPGSIYFYKQINGSWVFIERIFDSSGQIGNNFGYSLDIDENNIVVGSPNKHHNKGAVSIFEIIDNGGEAININLRDSLNAPDGSHGDRFGVSVGIKADHIIIGAPQDTLPDAKGKAYIYQKENMSWAHKTTLKTKASRLKDRFGTAVVITDSIAVVSATLSDNQGLNSGSAYIFQGEGATWEQKEVIVASDGILEEQFGTAIAIQKGDSVEIVIGASHALDTRGAAYLYSFQEDCVEDVTLPPVDNCMTTFFDSGRDVADYTSGEYTEWTFCPDDPTVENVHINFNSFEVESRSSGGCWDSLTVFNGPDTTSTVIGSFCGTSLTDAPGGGSISANNNSGCLTFRFRSDGSITKEGWIADVSCTEKTIPTCGELFIDNGGSQANYANQTDTVYIFCPDNPSTQKIELVFSEFGLESPSSISCYDSLIVYDGNNVNSALIGIYCGSGLDQAPGRGIIAAENSTGCLTLHFKSDDIYTSIGWIAEVNCITKSTVNINTCGTLFTDTGGIDGNYGDNEETTWILCPDNPQTEKVEVIFSEFNLDKSDTEVCNDYLEIFNGDNRWSEFYGQFCGNSINDLPNGGIISANNNSGCLMFRFKSGRLNNQTGWSAIMNCVEKGEIEPHSDCGRQFTDSHGRSANYDNSETTNFQFCPDNPSTEKIEIKFTEFDVEHNPSGGCYDYLEVFDSDDLTGTSLGQFCGNSIIDAPGGGTITATNDSGCLTFKFNSDAFFTKIGWYANVNCVDINQGLSDCDQDSVHVEIVENSITRQAKQHLTSNAVIDDSKNIAYLAGQSITLYPGFHAQANSTFLATIESCSDNLIQENNIIKLNKKAEKGNIKLSARPNPFSSKTTIEYSLLTSTNVTIRVVDILGREISLLEDSQKQKGNHNIIFESSQLEEGAYFIILQANNEIETLKLLHIK